MTPDDDLVAARLATERAQAVLDRFDLSTWPMSAAVSMRLSAKPDTCRRAVAIRCRWGVEGRDDEERGVDVFVTADEALDALGEVYLREAVRRILRQAVLHELDERVLYDGKPIGKS